MGHPFWKLPGPPFLLLYIKHCIGFLKLFSLFSAAHLVASAKKCCLSLSRILSSWCFFCGLSTRCHALQLLMWLSAQKSLYFLLFYFLLLLLFSINGCLWYLQVRSLVDGINLLILYCIEGIRTLDAIWDLCKYSLFNFLNLFSFSSSLLCLSCSSL